jgi:DNA-binding transcriptional MerR regulator
MLIKILEEKSGLSRDTVRFYEKQGLITPPDRLENGYRYYTAHTLVELRFIGLAQEIGFTLMDIKDAIPKLKAPPAHCEALVKRLKDRRASIKAEREALKKQITRIDYLIERFTK